MLNQEANETLMRVGRGTHMGELFRRFWVPALLEEEVPEPDGPPVEVRLLGEDLVAFRDTNGRVGLVDAYCPHRRAPLFLGRNEECGLRCVYHGWKFDVDGRCMDMPNEPADSKYKERMSVLTYPTKIAGGLVWAYLGPPDTMPADLPGLEWLSVSPECRIISKRLQENNWAQSVEGGIDSSHLSFLHREWEPASTGGAGALRALGQGSVPANEQVKAMKKMVGDGAPRFRTKASDFGLWVGARRSTESEGVYYWRITPFLLPFYTIIPTLISSSATGGYYSGHAWVPIDDENTWTYNMSWRTDRDFTEEDIAGFRIEGGVHCLGDQAYRPTQNRGNRYKIDRGLQKDGSYTGIRGTNTQDRAVQEMMGPMVDRSAEHLGTSDVGIISFRRLMLGLAAGLADGKEPKAPHLPAAYRVRSASLELAEDTDFVSASQQWLQLQ